MAETNNDGNREDGTPKQKGFLGELQRPDGNISTEVSIGVVLDDQAVSIPTLVPGLTDEERNQVLNDEMPESVVEKAVQHARMRMQQGKSPFWNPDDDEPKQPAANAEPWNQSYGSASYLNETEEAPIPVDNTAPWEIYQGMGTSYLGLGTPPRRTSFKDQRGGPTVDDERFNRIFDRLIQAESRGRHRGSSGELTTSPVGAMGITQVMPATAQDPGYGIQPIQDDSEEEFVRFGRDYLQAMLKEFDGNYEQALAAYNAGPGNVRKAITRGGARWKEFLPKRSETLPYIRKILDGEEGTV